MNKSELQKKFHLESSPELFEVALRPRSCGGNAEHERLALYGDSVLDMHLYDYLFEKGMMLKGQISKERGKIHKKPVIKAFAEEALNLSAVMSPLDKTYSPEERDLAETFEALLGASFQVNGLGACKDIVYSLIEFTQDEQRRLQEEDAFDPSRDYIGELLEKFPGKTKEKLLGELTEYRLLNGRNAYYINGITTLGNRTYDICTNSHSTKTMAQQEAAYILIRKIDGGEPMFGPACDMRPVQEKVVKQKASLDCVEIVFRGIQSEPEQEVSTGNGELLVDWAKRKAMKDALRMLLLISGRVDDVSTASWLCDTSAGALCLVSVKLEDEMYFALGVGPNNTQAKKDAGRKAMEVSSLISWLEEHYPDTET